MRPPKWLLAVVLCTAFALAGCGGGGDEGSTAAAPASTATTSSLTKEELIAQGDAICAEVNAAVGTVGSTGSEATSQAAQLYSGMVDRLQGLGTPSDDTAGYPEFIAAAEQLSQAENDVSLAADRGEEGPLAEAEADAASALASFQAAAQSYGFKECGEAPSAPTPGAGSGSGSEEAPEESPEGEVEEEAAPEVEEEVAPETGGAGAGEEGGGAAAGEEAGGGTEGGSNSGGIGPG